MGGLPIPKLQRCCFCTRKLKVACILIAVWSMLACCHSVRILFCPVCCKLYTRDGGPFHHLLSIVMWVLFGMNLLTLASSFVFLLGLFMGYRWSADIFMLFGFVTAVCMIVHAVLNVLQMIGSDCFNPSDAMAHFIYFLLWFYFILIVNSHRDSI